MPRTRLRRLFRSRPTRRGRSLSARNGSGTKWKFGSRTLGREFRRPFGRKFSSHFLQRKKSGKGQGRGWRSRAEQSPNMAAKSNSSRKSDGERRSSFDCRWKQRKTVKHFKEQGVT